MKSSQILGAAATLQELVETIAALRHPETGCPWDKEQTHLSLKRYLLEECYELVEAIDTGNPADICEELGDVLLQVLLHAQIAADAGQFDLGSVAASCNAKMIERHPHVFVTGQINLSEAELSAQWEKIKLASKPERQAESIFAGIPKEMPALAKALKTFKKITRKGLDLPPVLRSAELTASIVDEESLSQALLATVKKAQELKLDPEDILRRAIAKIQNNY